jgi:uncharacterized protein
VRAVLDTNVIVSAFSSPRTPPGRLLDSMASDQTFELVLSSALLEEIERVLRYPKVRKLILATDDELQLQLDLLDTLAIPVSGQLDLSGATRDPDDDRVLAAAVEGCADYLVTGDQDLLILREYEGIRIVAPRAFLKALAG